MDIILNQIAVWRKMGAKKLNIRPAPLGQRYLEPGGKVYQLASGTLYRYAKDYKIGKIEFSLFLRTFCQSENQVEQAMDYYANKLTKEYVLKALEKADLANFEYTPYIFNETEFLFEEKK